MSLKWVTAVDDIELDVCKCSPAAVQLMEAGAFPCAPLQPSLAVDLRVLEFALNLFVQISPNNTAFTLALERTLGALGFQLDHKVRRSLPAPNRRLITAPEFPAAAIRQLSHVVRPPPESHQGTLQRDC